MGWFFFHVPPSNTSTFISLLHHIFTAIDFIYILAPRVLDLGIYNAYRKDFSCGCTQSTLYIIISLPVHLDCRFAYSVVVIPMCTSKIQLNFNGLPAPGLLMISLSSFPVNHTVAAYVLRMDAPIRFLHLELVRKYMTSCEI